MTVEHPSDDFLQRHFDGELEPGEQAHADTHLASCPECSARLASLERLQQLIRVAAEDAAEQVDWHGLLARIERGAAEPERIERPAVQPAKVQSLQSGSRPRRIRPATMSALGALAVAAAVLLMVYRTDSESSQVEHEIDPNGDMLALGGGRSEVVQIDFGGYAGTVFDIDLSDGSSTPVVWIDDDEEGE